MIDCSKTENYFAEKQRMTGQRKDGICELNCIDCPLSSFNNGTGVQCSIFEALYSEKAIVIVQKWSDEHPRKTYLSELLKIFPNTPLGKDGTPNFCPYRLGLMSRYVCRKDRNCVKCWNQPLKDGEE